MATSLGQAYVQIVPKATGISKKIGDLLAPGSREAGEATGSSIASGIKKAIVAAGIGTAVIGTIKSAVSEGAKLQQSYGGLETIYGDAADAAKKYAEQAAQAGISANDYAEQAVSFGASLKQAFGGDTSKAVEAANTAIMDMTDNAAKMGTPIENIQNAYQGFAKQNFTMLDNLKLGYGGTKQEMERLLADAEKISGVHYDISNLGDVYDAIHVIQGELGLTGVAAQEASETFEGSFNAMKANAKNLLGAIAMGEDVKQPLNTLVKSVGTFLNNNLIPMVINVVKALPDVIATIIREGIPQLVGTLGSFITQVVQAIQQGLPQIRAAISAVVMMLIQNIQQNGPQMIQNIANLAVQIVQGILAQIPTFIQMVGTFLTTIVDTIIKSMPIILNAINQIIDAIVQYLPVIIPTMIQVGLQLFMALVGALPQIIEQIVAVLPVIIDSIVQMIPVIIPPLIEAGIAMFSALVEALPQIIEAIVAVLPTIIDSIVNTIITLLPLIIDAGVQLFIALIENLPLIIDTIVNSLPQIINAIVKGFIGNIDKIAMAGVKLFVALVKNFPRIIKEIVRSIPQLIASIVRAVGSGVSAMASAGADLIKGLWNGIKGVGGWLWDKVSGFLSDIWDGILDFFGIASPSKEMAWIGQMLDKGLAGGIMAAQAEVEKATDDLSNGVLTSMSEVTNGIKPELSGDFNIDAAGKNADSFWTRADSVSDSIVSGMATIMAGQSGNDKDIVIPIYLYPSGPKMGEETVKMYDLYKRQLG